MRHVSKCRGPGANRARGGTVFCFIPACPNADDDPVPMIWRGVIKDNNATEIKAQQQGQGHHRQHQQIAPKKCFANAVAEAKMSSRPPRPSMWCMRFAFATIAPPHHRFLFASVERHFKPRIQRRSQNRQAALLPPFVFLQ